MPPSLPRLLPDNCSSLLGTHIPAPECPKCGGPTYYKTGWFQPKPHTPFFSCIRYPACDGAVSEKRAEREEGIRIGAYDGDQDVEDYAFAFLHDVGDRL